MDEGAHEVTIMSFMSSEDKSETAIDSRIINTKGLKAKPDLTDMISVTLSGDPRSMVASPTLFASGTVATAFYVNYPGEHYVDQKGTHNTDSPFVLTLSHALDKNTNFLADLQKAPPCMQERYIITQCSYNGKTYHCALGTNLGIPLKKFLKDHKPQLSTSHIFSMIFGLHRELKQLYDANVIHGDLNDNNVLARFDSNKSGVIKVSLIDFGRTERIGVPVKRSVSQKGVDNFYHIAPEALITQQRDIATGQWVPEPPGQAPTWIPTASADIIGYAYALKKFLACLPKEAMVLLYVLTMRMTQEVDNPASRVSFSEVGDELQRIHSSCIQLQLALVAPAQCVFKPSGKQRIVSLCAIQEESGEDADRSRTDLTSGSQYSLSKTTSKKQKEKQGFQRRSLEEYEHPEGAEPLFLGEEEIDLFPAWSDLHRPTKKEASQVELKKKDKDASTSSSTTQETQPPPVPASSASTATATVEGVKLAATNRSFLLGIMAGLSHTPEEPNQDVDTRPTDSSKSQYSSLLSRREGDTPPSDSEDDLSEQENSPPTLRAFWEKSSWAAISPSTSKESQRDDDDIYSSMPPLVPIPLAPTVTGGNVEATVLSR